MVPGGRRIGCNNVAVTVRLCGEAGREALALAFWKARSKRKRKKKKKERFEYGDDNDNDKKEQKNDECIGLLMNQLNRS